MQSGCIFTGFPSTEDNYRELETAPKGGEDVQKPFLATLGSYHVGKPALCHRTGHCFPLYHGQATGYLMHELVETA